MRLVEICVDGGLEATLYSAQAQLADAYIANGSAAEARFIAEDLVAREPWDRANIERFRRALVLLGEPDPDALIAERLSGQSPFMSTDLSLRGDELPSFDAAAQPAARVAVPDPPTAIDVTRDEPPAAFGPTASAGATPELDPAPSPPEVERRVAAPVARGRSESVEVDLSIVLDDIPKPPETANAPAESAVAAAAADVSVPSELDGVFAQLRQEAVRRSAQSGADDDLKRGLALLEAGQFEAAAPVLQSASKSPRLRFEAASILGRMFRQRAMLREAVEWLERAAEAPPPTPDQGYQLLYELAEALEATGEMARALAICIELQAEAGDYRDIAARVDRLAKAQSRG
jgi:tetratricopeptide (TPR) repeat protein